MSKRLVSQRSEDNRFASSSRKVKLEESQESLQFKDEVDAEKSHSGQRDGVVLIKQETKSKTQPKNADRSTGNGVIRMQSSDVSEDQFQNASKTSSAEAFAPKNSSVPKIQGNQRCLLLQTVKKGHESPSKAPAQHQTPDVRGKAIHQGVFYIDKKSGSSVQREGMEAMGSIKGLETLVLDQKDGRFIGIRPEILTAEESNERRVQARVADSSSVFQSLLSREYTEESTGARTIRQSGGKDRHSKVVTSKGPRDRRVRLSVSTAIQFYDVQDRLGYDQPSKAVEWLIKKAKTSIDELQHLPDLGFQSFGADQPTGRVHASRILEPISGPFGAASCCADSFSCYGKGCGSSKCTGLSAKSTTTMNEQVDSEKGSESVKQTDKTQGEDQFVEEPIIGGATISSVMSEDKDMDCSSVLGSEGREEDRSPGGTDMAEKAREREEEKAKESVSDIVKWYAENADANHGSTGASTHLQYTQKDTSVCGLFNALNSCSAPASDSFFRPDPKPLKQTVTFSSSFHSLEALEKSALMQNLYESATPSFLLQNSAASTLSKTMLHNQFDHSSSVPLPLAPGAAMGSSEMQPFENTLPNNFFLQAHFQPSYPIMQQAISSHADNGVLTNTAPTMRSVFPVQDSNSLSAAASSFRPFSTHSPSQDEINSNIAVLHSLRMLSPELCDFGYPSNGNGLGVEASKFTPIHQGYLIGPMFASLLNQDEDLAHGPAYVEDMFSSIRPPLTDASEGSLSVSSISVSSSSAASLQSIYINPALPVSTTDAGYSLGSVKGTEMISTGTCTSYSSFLIPSSRIPARIHGFEDFEEDQEEAVT